MKVYEYLAAGLPVVATAAAVARRRGGVARRRDAEEIGRGARRLLARRRPQTRAPSGRGRQPALVGRAPRRDRRGRLARARDDRDRRHRVHAGRCGSRARRCGHVRRRRGRSARLGDGGVALRPASARRRRPDVLRSRDPGDRAASRSASRGAGRPPRYARARGGAACRTDFARGSRPSSRGGGRRAAYGEPCA